MPEMWRPFKCSSHKWAAKQIYKSCWDCQVSPTPCFLFLSKGCWTSFKLLRAQLCAWRIPTAQDRDWSFLHRHSSGELSFCTEGLCGQESCSKTQGFIQTQLQAPSKGGCPSCCSIIHFSECYTHHPSSFVWGQHIPEVQQPEKQTPSRIEMSP